jgi:hypothetical protein
MIQRQPFLERTAKQTARQNIEKATGQTPLLVRADDARKENVME